MKITVGRYSTVLITGVPDRRPVVEAYLYSHTRVIDYSMSPVFILITEASFDCVDSEIDKAVSKAAQYAKDLRRYQLDRFESGMHPTRTYPTRQLAESGALEIWETVMR